MKNIIALIISCFLIIFNGNAQSWSQVNKACGSNREEMGLFGSVVAISGDYAVVGASGEETDANGGANISGAGTAYVFKKTGDFWVQQQKIVASDRSQADVFGSSVAIDGDYIVVGASGDCEDENGANCLQQAGSAYIFKLTNGVWEQQQKLVAADRTGNDYFASTVDVSGDYILIGAIWDVEDANGQNPLNEAGSAYIFKQTNGVWTQQQKIVASDRSVEDRFGQSLAIKGDYAIVGAFQQDKDASGGNSMNNAGAAYIFKQTGDVWQQQQKIVSADRLANSWFGYSVDISNEFAIISAICDPLDATGGNGISNAGSVYFFKNTESGWTQQYKIVPADRNPYSPFFGSSVSISGNYALIGMPQDDYDNSGNSYSRAGSAYIFLRNGWMWEQQEKIVASDRWVDDYFGCSAAISGRNIIVGANGEDEDAFGNNTINYSGSAYFFEPAPLSLGITSGDVHCTGANDGYISVNTVGGYAPYQFSIDGLNFQTSNEFNNLISGNYSVIVNDSLGETVSENVIIAQGPSACGAIISLDADASVNYFDTITVKVNINSGSNLFSVYGKLNFDNSIMRLLDYNEMHYFGTTNIIATPPVVTSGVIDFGVTKTNGQPGTNGNGLFYIFRFLLTNLPAQVPFNSIIPDSIFTRFTLSNLTVYDATGIQRAVGIPQSDLTWLRYYVPVWPGDLNNDFVVNVADILPIGYFYNSAGSARPNASLQWIAQPASLWGFDKTYRNSSAYKTFADGNGNGLVDLADQSAIGFNLSHSHAMQVPNTVLKEKNNNAFQLSADIVPTTLDSTQLPIILNIPVRIDQPVNFTSALYGLAIDITFNPAYVDTANISLDFSNTIFGSQNVDYIRIDDLHPGSGRLSIGFTRYNTTPLYNYGELLNVNMPIKADVASGWFRFRILPLAANDMDGMDLEVDAGIDSVYIITSIPNAVEPLENDYALTLFPNPASDNVTLNTGNRSIGCSTLTIYNTTGQLLRSETVKEDNQPIDVSSLSNGIYFVEVSSKEGTEKQKLIIQK